MPQEVSVSYQAVKSKVYRLIDALVVGEKTEVEVQESIRRWWDLIHPADRPIAQKYLLIVLERSCLALDAVEEGLMEATDHEVCPARPSRPRPSSSWAESSSRPRSAPRSDPSQSASYVESASARNALRAEVSQPIVLVPASD